MNMNELSRTTYKDNHSKGNQHLILLINIVRMDYFGPDRPDPGANWWTPKSAWEAQHPGFESIEAWEERENPHEIVTGAMDLLFF